MDNLVNNYYFLTRLVERLQQILPGRKLAEVYGQNKHEYVFQLDEPGSGDALVFYFGNRVSFVFPDQKAKPRSSAKAFFQAINGAFVDDVQVLPNDRSFYMALSTGHTLLFKLYGVHGNVILFDGDAPAEMIRNRLQRDRESRLIDYGHTIDQSFEAYARASENGTLPWEGVRQLFPAFTHDFREYLTGQGLADTSTPEEQWEVLQKLLSQITRSPIMLHQEATEQLDDPGFRLSLFGEEQAETVYENPLTAVSEYGNRFLKSSQFLYYKQMLLSHWQKEIKQRKKRIKSFNNNLQKLIEGYDYHQLADIIMANLHTLNKGMTEAELYDFYNDQTIPVKLKQSLTPQANAERMYKKAKNQNIELATAEENLAREEERLALAETAYREIEQEQDFKNLKKQYQQLLGKPKQQSPAEQIKAKFKHFKVQGYDIYVGKGAAINDLLTFQFAKKEDLWLHTRDQKGAHVVVRLSKDQPLPNDVLESAAQLAAYYAKRKGEAFTTVVYTRKKYVWKPSGGEPGQVHYKNEAVIMVESQMPVTDR